MKLIASIILIASCAYAEIGNVYDLTQPVTYENAGGNNWILRYTSSGAPALPQFTSTVAWWKMDSATDTNDYSAIGTNNLIAYGGATVPTYAGTNEGFYFDGGDYFGCNKILFSPITNMSISCWFKMSNFVADAGIVWHRGAVLNKTFGLALGNTSGKAFAYVKRAGLFQSQANNTGDWVNVFINCSNNTNMTMYINGVSNASAIIGSGSITNDQTFYIGQDSGVASRKFKGNIKNVVVWINALSPNEVLQVYNLGR